MDTFTSLKHKHYKSKLFTPSSAIKANSHSAASVMQVQRCVTICAWQFCENWLLKMGCKLPHLWRWCKQWFWHLKTQKSHMFILGEHFRNLHMHKFNKHGNMQQHLTHKKNYPVWMSSEYDSLNWSWQYCNQKPIGCECKRCFMATVENVEKCCTEFCVRQQKYESFGSISNTTENVSKIRTKRPNIILTFWVVFVSNVSNKFWRWVLTHWRPSPPRSFPNQAFVFRSHCGCEQGAITTRARGWATLSKAQLLPLDNRLLRWFLTLSVSVWCKLQSETFSSAFSVRTRPWNTSQSGI